LTSGISAVPDGTDFRPGPRPRSSATAGILTLAQKAPLPSDAPLTLAVAIRASQTALREASTAPIPRRGGEAAIRQGCERAHSAVMAFEPRNLGTGFGVCLLAGDADAQLHAGPSICIRYFSWYRTMKLTHRIDFERKHRINEDRVGVIQACPRVSRGVVRRCVPSCELRRFSEGTSVASRKCLPPSLPGSYRHLRDISHTSTLNLLVSLCLQFAVRACRKRGGNSETGH
jgi:hypothetical protein